MSGGPGPSVLVVTAAMGSGHVQVAGELARRVRATGARVEVVDMIAAAGPAGERLRDTYEFLLRRAPLVYGAAMTFWARWPGPLEAFTARRAAPFERVLGQAVARADPDLVVSTYNLASQCLGRMIGRGELDVPVVTFVVDPGAHPYWLSPAVHRYLAVTPLTADRLRRLGARAVTVVAPVLRPQFAAPPDRGRARAALGLPQGRPVAVLSAGSWGVGGPARTLRVMRRVPGLVPVVLCGRDARLRATVGRLPGVRAVPWTAEVIDYLAAADVLVDNAGGQTCWEALACRTPVLIYRPLPGHGRLNAATLDRAGLVCWIRSRRALVTALTRVAARAVERPAAGRPAAAQPAVELPRVERLAPAAREPARDAVAVLLEQVQVRQ